MEHAERPPATSEQLTETFDTPFTLKWRSEPRPDGGLHHQQRGGSGTACRERQRAGT